MAGKLTRTELEDWKNGWYGVQLGLTTKEIDLLIERLQMLKVEPDQHLHLSSTYQGSGGLGDIYHRLGLRRCSMDARWLNFGCLPDLYFGA